MATLEQERKRMISKIRNIIRTEGFESYMKQREALKKEMMELGIDLMQRDSWQNKGHKKTTQKLKKGQVKRIKQLFMDM